MARTLPKDEPESDDGDPIKEYIQFRGRQTSVVLDEFGIRFSMEEKETPTRTFRVHKPLPVASEETIRNGDAPPNAVAAPLAEELTHGELSNSLIWYGVVCEHPTEDSEVCGEVFASPEAVSGHQSVHYQADQENQRDADSSQADADGDA
jgi:hypothetical protein